MTASEQTTNGKPTTTFDNLLREQIRSEFNAAQQYLAVAVWYDNQDLPRLAKHFYRQSLEERNHAMMIVQHLMDNGLPVVIPGVEGVHNDFTTVHEPVRLAVEQEKRVTDEITTLAKTARAEDNYIGEQFIQWFLAEQVEEVAQMTTLLNVVTRAGDDVFRIEDYLARETVGDHDESDPTAPPAAGGRL